MTIEDIINWGREHARDGHARDLTGHFTREQVEQWRRDLRRRYKDGERHIDGDFRRGYEVVTDTGEAVGLTNGYGPGFVVYYRQGAFYYA